MKKILVLDIETCPHRSFTWGLWNQNISLSQLIEASSVLCWAAKWVGHRQVYFASIMDSTPKEMIKQIHDLIDQAEAIITYNGKKFDMPTLMREFLLHKLPPPSPYQDIDLIQTVRRKFNFASNKLDHIAQELGIGNKVSHEGMPLWIECMAKNPKAWKIMKKYNIHDVKLTEEVYYKLQGWIVTQFNFNTHSSDHVCPACGSSHVQKQGIRITGANKYQRYQCQSCGKWSQSNKAIKELKKDEILKAI
jgi:DNA polymerase elongation subunit (family B)/predicted RNA-binding Zn-ribbon protein involved in translation (DUF1610 family)